MRSTWASRSCERRSGEVSIRMVLPRACTRMEQRRRRLRAVLEIFEPCFPQGDFKTVLRDVKALADALGERRDPDVHIEDMEEFEKHVQAAIRPGIEALVARLRARQARGNDTLAAALEHLRECNLHARLHSLADGAEELIA